MLLVISPAKKLNQSPLKQSLPVDATKYQFHQKTKTLAKQMKTYDQEQLEKMMGISPKLAELNFNRFQNFGKKSDHKPAIFLFAGICLNNKEKLF